MTDTNFTPANTQSHLQPMLWPIERLGETLLALAKASRLDIQSSFEIPALPESVLADGVEVLDRWIERLSDRMQIESEPLETSYRLVEGIVEGSAPALLRVVVAEQSYLLLVVRSGRNTITVLDPQGNRHKLPTSQVSAQIRQHLEGPLAEEIAQLLLVAQIPAQQQATTQRTLLQQQLGEKGIHAGWLVRPAVSTGFVPQLWQRGILQSVGFLLISHLLRVGSLLLVWYWLGRNMLQTQFDLSDFGLCAGLLLLQIPIRGCIQWLQGRISLSFGKLLKQRMLAGAMRFHPDEIRHQGIGQQLGRVIESEAIEMQALQGGFSTLSGLVDLLSAFWVLLVGTAGGLQAILLLLWLFLTATLCWRFYQKRTAWTESRLEMTHALIEKLIGHRTRLVQERRAHWHVEEDMALSEYLNRSIRMDWHSTLLLTLVSKGWLLIGVLSLFPLLSNSQLSSTALALVVGGIVSGYQALQGLLNGYSNIAWAIVAWQQIRHIFSAAERPVASGDAQVLAQRMQAKAQQPAERPPPLSVPVLQVSDVGYVYANRHREVLARCTLQVSQGDRILLEGGSGGGKSTLVALITGMRQASSGSLLLTGLDYPTLGDTGWHETVAAAPQFHENYVFTGSFAFNLLMGRRWPPHPDDLQLAEEICQELGLGPLLERMPGGLFQMVGDTGWQLSHGERSRLYIARALLQKADLLLFDESFAALDPNNIRRAIACVWKRAETVIVVAHP